MEMRIMKLMKFAIPILILIALSGCSPVIQDLALDAPDGGYPPFTTTMSVAGSNATQYVWEIEGKTHNQPENSIDVVINKLPCVVTVTMLGDGDPKTLTKTIELINTEPEIVDIEFYGNDIDIIVPVTKYIVTVNTTDKEGGDVRIVDVSVYTPQWLVGNVWKSYKTYYPGNIVSVQTASYICVTRNNEEPPNENWRKLGYDEQGRYNTVFSTPFVGDYPPKPDEYQAQVSYNIVLEDSFVFFSMWDSPIEGNSNLPWTPKSRFMDGYLGCWVNCCEQYWPKDAVPSGVTIITITVEDEMGMKSTKSFEFPASPYTNSGFPGAYL